MTTRQARTARAVTLRLLVLAGLVAMHHLAGGGHMAATHALGLGHRQPAGPMAMSTATSPAQVTLVGAATQPPAARPPTLRTAWSASSAGSSPMSGLCLAVLLTALAVLFLAVGRRAARPSTGGRGASPVASALGRGPPRLLLARLCVLRI